MPVDRHILDHRILFAIRVIRETLSCTIHEAIDVFVVRYEELRRDCPDDFTVGPEEYSLQPGLLLLIGGAPARKTRYARWRADLPRRWPGPECARRCRFP
ncbi:hypothetical protein BX257_0113 [Streptomyces sp. 3212.3]|nr:hypothetical protein BX257_0113 [Streptomyces sp. 3212.3]